MTDKTTVERGLAQWSIRLDSVVEFVSANGRLPSAECSEESERFIGQWITNQKSMFRIGTLTPTRVALLDERLPLWREVRRTRMSWEQALDAAADFISANGRFPEAICPEEAFLAEWMNRQREVSRRPLSEKRLALLDEKIPNWRTGKPDRQFLQKVNEVLAFHNKHGRYPVISMLVPEERTIGNWLSDVRRRMGKGTLSDVRIAALNEMLPEWDIVKDTGWTLQLQAITNFIEANGTVPSSSSDDHREKQLGTTLKQLQSLFSKSRLTAADREFVQSKFPEWGTTSIRTKY